MAGYNLVIMTQEQAKKMLCELIEKSEPNIIEISETSFNGSISKRGIAIVWKNAKDLTFHVQLSNNNALAFPNGFFVFYNDEIHLSHCSNIIFKQCEGSAEYSSLPEEVIDYIWNHELLKREDTIENKLADTIKSVLLNKNEWIILDPFIK